MKKKKESNPVYLAKDKQKFAKQKHGGGGGVRKKGMKVGLEVLYCKIQKSAEPKRALGISC